MASTIIQPGASKTFTVPASDKLATYSTANYQVIQTTSFANYPPSQSVLFSASGANTTSAFSAAATITISAGAAPVYYSGGTGAVVVERQPIYGYQTTPGTLNATGTLTVALVTGGIVTSTTAAAVAATLDTGALFDSTIDIAVDESFEWVAINTGGTNAFTVTASTGHTIVGAGAVAASTSGRFRTRKTAADTFVTYRIG